MPAKSSINELFQRLVGPSEAAAGVLPPVSPKRLLVMLKKLKPAFQDLPEPASPKEQAGIAYRFAKRSRGVPLSDIELVPRLRVDPRLTARAVARVTGPGASGDVVFGPTGFYPEMWDIPVEHRQRVLAHLIRWPAQSLRGYFMALRSEPGGALAHEIGHLKTPRHLFNPMFPGEPREAVMARRPFLEGIADLYAALTTGGLPVQDKYIREFARRYISKAGLPELTKEEKEFRRILGVYHELGSK